MQKALLRITECGNETPIRKICRHLAEESGGVFSDAALRGKVIRLLKVSAADEESCRTLAPAALKTHGNQVLSDAEEAILVGVILAHVNRGKPVSLTFAQELAGALHPGEQFGRTWASWFLKRHSDVLKSTSGKRLSEARRSPLIVTNTETFLDRYPRLCEFLFSATKPAKPEDVFNADETLLSVASQVNRAPIITCTAQNAAAASEKTGTVGSIVPFVNAIGNCFLLIVCYKCTSTQATSLSVVEIDVKARRSDVGPMMVQHIATVSGFMTTQSWRMAMRFFAQARTNAGLKSSCVLLMDNLAAHKDYEVVSVGMNNGIYTCFLPPNTSHLLQPLDQAPFAIFKRELAREVGAQMRTDAWGNRPDRAAVKILQSVPKAFAAAFKPHIIQGAWSATGLYPFDANKVRQLAKENSNAVSVQELVHGAVPAAKSKMIEMAHTIWTTKLAKIQKDKTNTKVVRVKDAYNNGVDCFDVIKLADTIAVLEKAKVEEKARNKEAMVRKKAEKAEKHARTVARKQEAAKKHAYRCMGTAKTGRCRAIWKAEARKAEAWYWCQKCDGHGLCPTHYVNRSKDKLAQKAHEATCKGNMVAAGPEPG